MGYFDQYSSTAGSIADSYNIPRPVFFGLIQQESGWNPNAVGDNGAAIGFGQLHAGAAADTGFNRFDPIQNLQGSAAYLSKQINKFGGNITQGLAAYNQGAGNVSKGLGYAKSVLDKAQKFMNGGNINDIAQIAAGNPLAAVDLLGNVIGGGGDSCGLNPICYLRQWIDSTSFFSRLALAILAFLLILGALIMYKPEVVTTAAKAAA